MRHLYRIATVMMLGMVVPLAGCSSPFAERLSSTFSFIGEAKAASVSRKAVVVSADVFNGMQVAATQYLRLPRCTPVSGPVACRDSRATKPLISAVYAGRKARNAAIAYVKAHPCPIGADGIRQADCPIGASGLYDGLQTAIATAQNIFFNYNVEATVAAIKARR